MKFSWSRLEPLSVQESISKVKGQYLWLVFGWVTTLSLFSHFLSFFLSFSQFFSPPPFLPFPPLSLSPFFSLLPSFPFLFPFSSPCKAYETQNVELWDAAFVQAPAQSITPICFIVFHRWANHAAPCRNYETFRPPYETSRRRLGQPQASIFRQTAFHWPILVKSYFFGSAAVSDQINSQKIQSACWD